MGKYDCYLQEKKDWNEKKRNQEKKSKNLTPDNWCGYMWLGVQSALEKNNYKDQTRLAVSTNADKEINNLLHETPMFSAFCEDTYSRISLLLSGFHCNMPWHANWLFILSSTGTCGHCLVRFQMCKNRSFGPCDLSFSGKIQTMKSNYRIIFKFSLDACVRSSS